MEVTKEELMETPKEEFTVSMRKNYDRIGFGLLAAAAATTVVQFLLQIVMNYVDFGDWFSWVATFFPLYLVGIPVALLIFPKKTSSISEPQKLGVKNFFLFLMMCFPLMYGGSILGVLISLVLSGGQATNSVTAIFMDDSWWKIVFAVVLAPLCEEFLFRKQIIDRSAKYNEKIAVIFSALVFGLFHMNLYQFFYAFALGWLFGYIYLKTHRLRYTAALHMIINFMGTVVAPYLMRDLDVLDHVETMGDMMAVLPNVAALGLYVVFLIGISVVGLVFLILYAKRFHYQKMSVEVTKRELLKATYCNPGVILFTLGCIAVCVYALQIF